MVAVRAPITAIQHDLHLTEVQLGWLVAVPVGLVDTCTTPQLLKLIAGGQLDPTPFATHHFSMDDAIKAYGVFADASTTNALKVVLSAGTPSIEAPRTEPAMAPA